MNEIGKILVQAKNLLPKWRTTMNLSVKTMLWMVASPLMVTSIFGQQQNQDQDSCMPQPLVCKPAPRCGPLQAPQQPMNCAYNAPAEINIGIQDDIDFFASSSFIYWQPSLDNMEVAFANTTNVLNLPIITPEPSFKASWIEMDFEYKPGFKVGLGMNLQRDDWDGYAEYTRIHGTHSTSSNGPTTLPNIFANWGHPFALQNNMVGQAFTSVYANYRNNLDFADVEMGRTYYVGKSLIFRSAWGARAAWILQNIHVAYSNTYPVSLADTGAFVNAHPGFVNVYQRINSWAVGPRAGLIMDWMLGCGIRFFGSGYGDILYTKYKLQEKTVAIATTNDNSPRLLIGQPYSFITRDKVGLVRSHLDLEWGLGWGSYFDNNNWHLDLSASYGYQVFFNQNMFRYGSDAAFAAKGSINNGNLYVQGLTATVRLDF